VNLFKQRINKPETDKRNAALDQDDASDWSPVLPCEPWIDDESTLLRCPVTGTPVQRSIGYPTSPGLLNPPTDEDESDEGS